MVVLPPGARTRALAVCTRGIGGARCWWGWWVLVIGAVPVVGVGEVGGGAVSWSCVCGCRCCWASCCRGCTSEIEDGQVRT